jgi:PTS system fructose-specific IIA component/PTS system nitrogen regulatory IIA component
MKFADFVVVKSIQPNLAATDKESVLRELIGGLVAAGQIPKDAMDDVCATVLEREHLGSTGIGRGVAVPHAKHSGVARPVGTVGISRAGVDFQSLDGEPVHLFFSLVSPPERATDHLAVLEYVSRQLRKDLFCKLLREAESADAVWQILEETDQSDGEAFA